MKGHVNWPEERSLWPVWVEVGGSAEQILATGYLTAEIKASNVRALGVLLDADVSATGRFQRIRQLCSNLFPNLPGQMPSGGLVAENDEGKRFGLWLMPDNSSPGDLETFLRYLIPGEQERLWEQARENVGTAILNGAPCHAAHIPKANLYTWLAWQDPPGQSPGLALTRNVLDPQSIHARVFVKWFMELYGL